LIEKKLMIGKRQMGLKNKNSSFESNWGEMIKWERETNWRRQPDRIDSQKD
jgi:hypothetical protein